MINLNNLTKIPPNTLLNLSKVDPLDHLGRSRWMNNLGLNQSKRRYMTTIAELLAEKCAHHEASKKALPEAWRRLKVAIRELEAVEPKAIYVGEYGDNETLTVTSNFSRARQNIGIDKGWGEITITCYGRSRSRIERVRPLKELYKVSVQQGEVGFSNTDPDSSVESFHTPEELAEVAIRLYLKMA